MTQLSLFVGSCDNDEIGVGTLIYGSQIRKEDGVNQVLDRDSGEWVDCFCVDEVKIVNDKFVMTPL